MNRLLFILLISTVLVTFFTAFSSTFADDDKPDIKAAGAKIKVISENADNIFAAGANVSIEGHAAEDVWVAGAIVDVNAKVDGNMHAAGARIYLKGTVRGNVKLAGADLKVDADIEESLNAAAASIVVSQNTKIDDESSLVAASIDFHGTVEDDLNLYADEVIFSGQASDSVTIEGRNVQLGKTAKINGDLIIRSSEKATISPSASITGKVTQTSLEDSEFFKQRGDESDGRGFFILLSTSIFLLGLMLVIFLRGFSEQAITTLRFKPVRSLLLGLLVFFGIPLFAFFVMFTIIGIPVGIAIFLLLPFLLILSLTTTSLGISDWLLNKKNESKKTGQRLLLLAVGVILLIIVGFIPLIGGLLIFLALLIGLGAVTVTIITRLSGRPKELTT